MVHRGQPNNTLHGAHAKPVTKMISLDSRLGGESEDHFYTGFSNEIDDGGIFVTTFNIQPVNTPAEVSITFPDGERIEVQGAVEWVREFNPLVPEMQPGMGVGLRGLGAPERSRIEDYILSNPSFFWDSSPESGPAAATGPATDDIQGYDIPAGLGLEPDIRDEHLFLKGMLRDIGEYMKSREVPHTWEVPPFSKTPVFSGTLVRARLLPERSLRGFAGGFSDVDGDRRVFVSTSNPLPVGAVVVLRLEVGRRELELRGTVRWVRRRNPLVGNPLVLQGMGISVDHVVEGSWLQVSPGAGETLLCEETL